jgi:hypothetical protein
MRRKKKAKSVLEGNIDKLHWQNMCLRKSIFWTEVAAVRKAKLITDKGTPMRAYQCPNCMQWHLTSQVVEEQKKTGT